MTSADGSGSASLSAGGLDYDAYFSYGQHSHLAPYYSGAVAPHAEELYGAVCPGPPGAVKRPWRSPQ
jgi:hypothetical protein